GTHSAAGHSRRAGSGSLSTKATSPREKNAAASKGISVSTAAIQIAGPIVNPMPPEGNMPIRFNPWKGYAILNTAAAGTAAARSNRQQGQRAFQPHSTRSLQQHGVAGPQVFLQPRASLLRRRDKECLGSAVRRSTHQRRGQA